MPRVSAAIVCVVSIATFLLDDAPAVAQPRDPAAREQFRENYIPPAKRQFRVDGGVREALVFVPKTAVDTPAPVVFAFHGHGGSMQKSVEMFGFHQAWREAIVVYPQGLPTVTPGDPQGQRAGWVVVERDEGNRDLKFFDALLAALEGEYKVDRTRIYAAGSSNGGFFTYTLWATRPETLAAVAPAAATLGRLQGQLTPKPVLCVAGEQDDTVPFAQQQEAFAKLRELNGCEAPRPGRRPAVTTYPSPQGTPVVTFIHKGGHGFPAEASPVIVEFFKRNVRTADAPTAASD
jgi:polyhydroxybutyrate depolymerase